MTTSHAADGNTTPVLGWACALLLGLLMAGVLLCAALFVSSRRNVEAAQNPHTGFTAARADDAPVNSAQPDSRKYAREYETSAGSAD